MSAIKLSLETFPTDRKTDVEPLDPVMEINENIVTQIFDRPREEAEFKEISPRIFSLKDIKEPLTKESLNNAIYELGIVNLCWPEIEEPVFETRTCFPKSYYTNTDKERLLLAYAENFRRQFQFHYKFRRPLLLQAPNECGMQKMVCTTIRPTKICYAGTNTWEGVATLVSDYFDYEPLTKPMLHPCSAGVRISTTPYHPMGVVKEDRGNLKLKMGTSILLITALRKYKTVADPPAKFGNYNNTPI